MKPEEFFALDSSALLCLWKGEPGKEVVEEALQKVKKKKAEINILSTDIALAYYHLLQEKGEAAAKDFMEEMGNLPLNIIAVNKKIAAEAADCMYEYGIEEYTQALSCALAIISSGKLLTGREQLTKVSEAEPLLITS